MVNQFDSALLSSRNEYETIICISSSLSVVCETCVDYVMALYVNDVYGEDATLSGLLLSGLSLSSILFSFILGSVTVDNFKSFMKILHFKILPVSRMYWFR